MNASQNISTASFTIENCKWIEEYNRRSLSQETIDRHHLETKHNSGNKTLKKLYRILLQNS